MISHTASRALFQSAAPTLTLNERLVAQAIALHETSYGAGWKTPEGLASNNLGAIMRPTSDPGPFFTNPDSNPSGPFVGHFKVYPTAQDGAADVVAVALKPNVRAAAAAGDLPGVAAAMFANHYYTGTAPDPATNVSRYFSALTNAVNRIVAETKEANPFGPKAQPPASPPAPAPPSPSSPSSPSLLTATVPAAASELAIVRIWQGDDGARGFTIELGTSMHSGPLAALVTWLVELGLDGSE